MPWWYTSQWNSIVWYVLNGMDQCSPNWEGNYQVMTSWNLMGRWPGRRMDHATECSLSLLPSKWLYYTTYVKCSAHDRIPQQKQWSSMFTTQDHVQETWETSINHTVLHIKPTLWPLVTTEEQGTQVKTETSIPHRHCHRRGHWRHRYRPWQWQWKHSLDTMLAFGGSEVDGYLGNLLASSQANLTMLTRDNKWLMITSG